jgi:hypothetical protein
MPLWAAVVVAAGMLGGGQDADRRVLTIDGQIVASVDALPRKDAVEFRPQALFDAAGRGQHVGFRAEVALEALAADRGETARSAAVRPRDVWVELTSKRGDLRAGYGRVIWGRLDEIQPSDVVNPIDAARFLLDGRAEARLAVTFVRGRLFASDRFSVEGVLVPRFRRGSFDERDEETSPFNLVRDAVLPAGITLASSRVRQIEPEAAWANVSGGGRVSATIGRVDVAAAVFRGFDAFGPITFEITSGPAPAVVGDLVERHPRFTMIAGDFETVLGQWAVRGEAAVFVDRTFAGASQPMFVKGRSRDAGFGVDRRAGDYRLFASMLVHHESSPDDPGVDRTDVTVVGSIERKFRRERWLLRVFGLANPADQSSFLRGLVAWKPRDNVTVEASAAAILGTSDDNIGRFKGRDFVFGRLRYHF